MTQRIKLLAGGLIVPLTASCSLAFMNKPREPVAAPSYPMECTTSRVAPILDVLGLTYFVANGIYWINRTECTPLGSPDCADSGTKTFGALLSAGLVITYAASSYVGFSSATRCEALKDLNARCMTGDDVSCRKLNPSWVPPRAGQALPAGPASPAPSGCTKDSDCKGDRICVQAACTDPTRRGPPLQPAVPSPPKPTDSCERDSDCDYGICSEGRCRH